MTTAPPLSFVGIAIGALLLMLLGGPGADGASLDGPSLDGTARPAADPVFVPEAAVSVEVAQAPVATQGALRRPGLRGRLAPARTAADAALAQAIEGLRTPIESGVIASRISDLVRVHFRPDDPLQLDEETRAAVERVFAAARARLEDLYDLPNDQAERWRDANRSAGFEETCVPGTAETFGEAAARITARAIEDAEVHVGADARVAFRALAQRTFGGQRLESRAAQDGVVRATLWGPGYLAVDAS